MVACARRCRPLLLTSVGSGDGGGEMGAAAAVDGNEATGDGRRAWRLCDERAGCRGTPSLSPAPLHVGQKPTVTRVGFGTRSGPWRRGLVWSFCRAVRGRDCSDERIKEVGPKLVGGTPTTYGHRAIAAILYESNGTVRSPSNRQGYHGGMNTMTLDWAFRRTS
ncbi:hypothetical protein E2562_025106 [Oryza meyeriana var. granulata]|uniref:Uncharacterized protein n=1 Tax=Oryza meyeriana var. granulata TaxID=110450 RepID=A0A6G1CIG1_9ORYZ|nr:hypothetical protein E2562_025106 [Oryza meyeriana var. granulata]